MKLYVSRREFSVLMHIEREGQRFMRFGEVGRVPQEFDDMVEVLIGDAELYAKILVLQPQVQLEVMDGLRWPAYRGRIALSPSESEFLPERYKAARERFLSGR